MRCPLTSLSYNYFVRFQFRVHVRQLRSRSLFIYISACSLHLASRNFSAWVMHYALYSSYAQRRLPQVKNVSEKPLGATGTEEPPPFQPAPLDPVSACTVERQNPVGSAPFCFCFLNSGGRHNMDKEVAIWRNSKDL
jgi:hypothetical protein